MTNIQTIRKNFLRGLKRFLRIAFQSRSESEFDNTVRKHAIVHKNPLSVQKRAFSSFRRESFFRKRVIYDPENDFSIQKQPQRYGTQPKIEHQIGRSVDRVQNPTIFSPGARILPLRS